jgi:hypothetical protein
MKGDLGGKKKGNNIGHCEKKNRIIMCPIPNSYREIAF